MTKQNKADEQGDALTPGAIATMRELGWSEAQIEAQRQEAERIRAAGGFQNWVVMCEAARIASEARGYTVPPENFKVVRRFETEAERLADIAQDELHATTPQLWAWNMSAELRERNPGMNYTAQCVAERQIMRTFEAHADTLPLRQMPSRLPWPKGEPLPPKWREGHCMTKAELRAWAKEYAPDLLGSALLAEPAPESAPAGKAVTIAGPPPMGNSTKGKRAHPLAAQIRKAQAQAEEAGDAAARWERGAVWAPLRAMALEECEPFTGAVSAKGLAYTDAANCRQVFTPEALAAHLKRQREKVTPADAIRR